MVQNGPKWSMVIHNGPNWSNMVQSSQKGLIWSNIVQNGSKLSKWSKVVQCHPKSSKLILNSQKLYKMVQILKRVQYSPILSKTIIIGPTKNQNVTTIVQNGPN